MNTSIDTPIKISTNKFTNKSTNTTNTTYEYKPDSIWSNIKYLTGILVVIIIPPLIPGVTTQGLVISYVGIVLGIYIIAFVIKLTLVIRLKNNPQTKRR